MKIGMLSDAELLVRIGAVWLRDRRDPSSASLRELLDEAARRANSDGAGRPRLDTPTETPASRRKSSTPPRE
jgi:hypothetical protein